MAVPPLVQNQPLQQAQPIQISSGQDGLIKKISDFVLSKWAAVAASAIVAGACFGVLVGLGVGLAAALIAIFISKRGEAPQGVIPAPLAPIPGDPNSREYNVGIFNQTQEIIREGLRIDADQHRQTLEGAVIVPELGRQAPPAHPVATQFWVEPVTTYEMTRRLVQQGHRPLVLDMANRYTRGGGVTTGARAQEETLCRQSNLYPALERLAYPLPEKGGAYVPGVQFFRDDAYNVVEPFVADVFVSAAYNCNRAHGPGYDRPGPDGEDEFYAVGTDAKIRTMLRSAIQHGNRSLVLSAFGCGAFRNDPNVISATYRRILNEVEFRGAFDAVAFGIYDPPGARDQNYPIFRIRIP